jgi:hypothetical protein
VAVLSISYRVRFAGSSESAKQFSERTVVNSSLSSMSI